jgi:hypothetical protein
MTCEESPTFNGVNAYVTGRTQVTGSVSFLRFIYATVIYFREESATSPNPFTDLLAITPLSDPYQILNGHHIFNLSFYSELTIIDGPPRLCFHDPTQELSLSLNFVTKAAFQSLFDFLRYKLSIVVCERPGIFSVRRLHPQLCCDESFRTEKQRRRSSFSSEPVISDSADSLAAHGQLLATLTQAIGIKRDRVMQDATPDEVMAALSSRSQLRTLLAHASVPDRLKWRAWLVLIGLYPVESIGDEFRRQYQSVKLQWKTITKSQFSRGQFFRTTLDGALEFIQINCHAILGIVDNKAIIGIAQSVLLTIVHLFQSVGKQLDILLDIFKVLLWILVKTVQGGSEPLFVNGEGVEYNSETLELLLFWSFLFIFEVGETRLSLLEGKYDPTEEISDFITLVHEPLAQKIFSMGGYGRLRPVIAGQFSTALPVDKCADVWLAAAAAKSFKDFIQFTLVACLLFNFPMMSAETDLQTVIAPTLQLISHRYLEAAAFVLCERAQDMVREHLKAA